MIKRKISRRTAVTQDVSEGVRYRQLNTETAHYALYILLELELELERCLFDKVEENARCAQQYKGKHTMPGDIY